MIHARKIPTTDIAAALAAGRLVVAETRLFGDDDAMVLSACDNFVG